MRADRQGGTLATVHESAKPARYVVHPVDGPGPGDTPPINPRRLLWLLWRRKWQVLAVAAIVVIPATVATLLAQPLYRSTTLIEVTQDQQNVLPYADVPQRGTTGNYLFYMTTQEQLLRGAGLAARVAGRMRESSDPLVRAEAERVNRHIQIAQVPNSQLFRIGYQAPTPAAAAAVANLFAEEYIKGRFESGQETRKKARDMLQRELVQLEARVQASEQQLVDYAQAHNIVTAGENGADLAEDKLAALARQLVDAESDVVAAQSALGSLQTSTVAEFPDSLATPVIAGLTSSLLQLEHELTALRSRFGENWPAVVQKREEVDVVRGQLEREKATVLARAKEQAQVNLRAAESRRDLTNQARAAQQELVGSLQNASIQYNIIRREVETNQKLYEGLLERLKETGIVSGMELGTVYVVEPAVADPSSVTPDVLWNLELALAIGLALGVTVVIARDFWSDAMSTVEEVEQVTVVPVLAPVPLVRPEKPRKRLTGAEANGDGTALQVSQSNGHPHRIDIGASPMGAEAIRALCASLLLSRSDRPPRIIVVTSANPGEGKTTIVTELGRALADTGAATLLVEGDMRRPTFAEQFGFNGQGGLSLFLAGHVDRPTIHQTNRPALAVVGAGPAAPNPVALLSSERLARFLRESTSAYSFIIIDSPPAISMADARVMGAAADGVVLVVRAGKTTKTMLRRVQSVLEGAGATLLGTVLNGTEAGDIDSAYYHGYGADDERA